MKGFVKFAEGLLVAGLAQTPAIASSHAVQDFISRHPADAALVPLAAGVLNVLYGLLKKKVAPVPPTPPAVAPKA